MAHRPQRREQCLNLFMDLLHLLKDDRASPKVSSGRMSPGPDPPHDAGRTVDSITSQS